MDYIYFDNAATSWPKPDVMMQAMVDFNRNIGANPGRSGPRLSIEEARIVFDAREAMATLLNAEGPDTIIFTRNATEALNIVLHGFLRPGDHVITSSMEHNSVMRPLHALLEQGIKLTVVRCSPEGVLDPSDIERAIEKETRLIITTHASNVTGNIMPISEIAMLARARGIVYCVDAAQTAGSLPIDVKRDGIDIMAFTGHKSLTGPRAQAGFISDQAWRRWLNPQSREAQGAALNLRSIQILCRTGLNPGHPIL